MHAWLFGITLLLTPLPERTLEGAGEESHRAYLGGRVARQTEERLGLFRRGIAAGRDALQGRPDDPAGLLWLAANLGAEALERGKWAALKVLPEMERLLLRLEAVAPRFEHAAAARVLARLYHKAPAFISIGSSKKARAFFEKALQRAPDFPGNQALAAAFLSDEGDKERALGLARAVLRRTDLESIFGDEAKEWREIAQAIVEDEGP